MALPKNILILFSLVLAALLFDGIGTYRNLMQWSKDNQWVVHTQRVIIEIEEARSSFRFSVNRYQAYLITGNRGYLSDLEIFDRQSRKSLDVLRGLTADNPSQQKRLGEIRSLADAQDDIYQKSFQAWKKGKTNHPQQIVWVTELSHLADQIEITAIAATGEENALLLERTTESAKIIRQTYWIFGLSLGVTLLLVLCTAYLFNRGRVIQAKLRQAEDVFEKSEHRFRALVENVKDYAIIFLDPQGCVATWNEGARGFQGYEGSEIIGKHFSCFYTTEDIAQNKPGELLKTALEKGHAEEECWRVRKDGSLFYADVVLTAIRDKKGVLQDFAKITRDITERKEIEEKLRVHAKMLEESNASLRDFASVASHDLQEPLRKILTFGKFLVDDYRGSLGKTGQGYVDRMSAAATRMQDLIHALLDLTRVSTQQEDFHPVSLSRIVKEVLSDLETRIQETKAQLVIGDLPTLEADATQMRQLFQNLIGNALKYHAPGIAPEISVTSEKVEETPAIGDKFRITVKDKGIGFEREYSEKIFAVFERLNVRDKYGGTGIGLAICKKVVERHGGTISAEGTPGQGSVFTVILPMRQKGVKTYGRNQETRSDPGGGR